MINKNRLSCFTISRIILLLKAKKRIVHMEPFHREFSLGEREQMENMEDGLGAFLLND